LAAYSGWGLTKELRMSMLLEVKSRPAEVVSAWASTGFLTGIALGCGYGVGLAILDRAVSGLSVEMSLPFTLAIGCVIGMLAGAVTGTCTGLVIAMLARPLRLSPGRRGARVRSAAVAVAMIELFLLPLQSLLIQALPLPVVLAVTAPCLLAGLVAALRLPPGARPADKHAMVRIQTL
jgi:hypothetical protein